MIIFHPKFKTRLSEFGIKLPLRDDRASCVFELLQKEFSDLNIDKLENFSMIGKDELLLTHDKAFINSWFEDDGFRQSIRYTYDCPSSKYPNFLQSKAAIEGLRQSILEQVSGTKLAFERALQENFCFFLGGGMHHARSNFGSGFCPLNDIVTSIRLSQKKGLVKKVLVIDIDAHMGDGTAELCRDDDSIFTFSIHMARGWPMQSELEVIPSDLDVEVSCEDQAQYLEKLKHGLSQINGHSFDACIVLAGADVYEKDELLSTNELNLTKEEILARDFIVYKWAKRFELPQLWLMAGGYGQFTPEIYANFISKLMHIL